MLGSRPTPLVLVADDQVPTTMMLRRVFEYEGFEVNTVYDGPSALESARATLPDLILLDVNMPGMNGFEVLQHLRDHPATVGIPTILITAMGELSDVVTGLRLGADDYVRKPFHPRELLARAQSKMRARKLEEALQRRTHELEALLRVSDELNQHLEMEDLLTLIVDLTLQMLPGQLVTLYQVDTDDTILSMEYASADNQPGAAEAALDHIDHHALVTAAFDAGQICLCTDDDAITGDFNNTIATVLLYSEISVRAVLAVHAAGSFDDNHRKLLAGIGRQATLALRNAELYQIKSNYADHLEEMVSARTEELRSAQQMLIRAEKLASVGRLAASVAHEINNPLLPIQINLDDMLEDLRDQRPIDPEEILRTQESVERIRRVVNRLLEFTGKPLLMVRTTGLLDVNRILQNTVDLVRKSFEQSRKQLIVDLANLPLIYGDQDGLEQVFLNLILNAHEAMSAGDELRITSRQDGDYVTITVTDNGSGIPDAIIHDIFEPFFTTKEDGNGLGLYISYGIIQNHKGTLQVESKVGDHTRFTVRLPLQPDTARA